MLRKYELPNIIDEKLNLSKYSWKTLVKNNILKYSEEKLASDFLGYSKLRGGPLTKEKLEIKPYIKELKLHEARTMFRIRTLMMPAKLNMKNNPKFANQQWKCDACKRIDSQSHILWCPYFAPVREGKNINEDKDLVDYFQKVFKSEKTLRMRDLEAN